MATVSRAGAAFIAGGARSHRIVANLWERAPPASLSLEGKVAPTPPECRIGSQPFPITAPDAEGLHPMRMHSALSIALTAVILAWPALAISADPAADSASAGCGYVSTSAKPPLSEDLYPAEIKRIDGDDVRKLNRHRLGVGSHAVSIQELIGSTPRGYTKLRKLGNREVALVYKVVRIDVEPNTSYQIAARLRNDRLDPDQPHAYWEPVVWRSTAEDCR
jgi:hypothetical protein